MKSLQASGAGWGAYDVKEANIMKDSEPAASSNLREETRTTMNKRVRAMAHLCSIYNVHFKTLVEEHELVVGYNLSETVDFSLAYSPYGVQKDLNDNHKRYNVIVSIDMKDILKVLEDLMKTGSHGHVF